MDAQRIQIKPSKAGVAVPFAPPSTKTLPPEGCAVRWSPWWAERLREGDVEIVKAEVAKTPKPKKKEA